MSIKKHLVKFNESTLPESFVALAVEIDANMRPYHAAILIRLKNVNHLHHYGGAPILEENFNTNNWFIYKIFDTINIDDEDEVGAFLLHCKRVNSNSMMTYSFIADGSSYDELGEFVSASGLPELGTCVTYCINTLSTSLIDSDSYLELDDWTDCDVSGVEYLDNYGLASAFSKYPNLDRGLYNAFRKRITPLEYLCSAFISEHPIRKEHIDEIKDDVRENIVKKLEAA